jgi:tRNA A37 threonylcarbamoyladenosine dehydratase
MENRFIRQQELVNQDKLSSLSVTVVGCGAVGSFTACNRRSKSVPNFDYESAV